MVSRQEDTHLFNGHSEQTTWWCMVSPRRCPVRLRLRMEATSRNVQEESRDAISRAQHTTRKETIELSPGSWVLYLCCGKSDSWSDRGSIQFKSLVGTCACHDSVSQQWSGPVNSMVVVEGPSTCQDSHLTGKTRASQGSPLRVAQGSHQRSGQPRKLLPSPTS